MSNNLKVFIFNDTRYDHHFGCLLTMNVLLGSLSERGMHILGTSPSNSTWRTDKNVIRKLHNSDIVIVNGEGTFHHNQEAAFRLAEVASYCKEIDKPSYLINSVYCANDLNMAKKVKDFTKIYVRDTQSKIELKRFEIESNVVPDLIFKTHFNLTKYEKDGLLITDAVSHPEILPDSNQKLFDLSNRYKASYLPLFTHLFPVNKSSFLEYIIFFRYFLVTLSFLFIGLFRDISFLKKQRTYYACNEDSYWNKIAGSKMILTGRYHGMCSAIIARTPFLALKSNSHKVESLLESIGLGKERLIYHEDLREFNKLDFKPFTQEELTLITDYCFKAEQEINNMFDEILKA